MLRRSVDAGTSSRFQILDAIGSGGFGSVHEAIDLRTGQRVAVKHLGNTSGTAIARFKNEFRALADCHHPNLVGLKELIEDDGKWLIVMELVPGTDLLDYVRGPQLSAAPERAQFDEARLRSALSGVAEGLIALHGFGILHRDLKPSNVRVRPDGRAVLLDFGLAASVEELHDSSDAMVGTVRYMAPEQAGGENVGPPADVYALGVCLFEALTGAVPFEGEQALAILAQKREARAQLASTLNRTVPADLDALCARMLATSPEQRPELDQVLAVLGGADPDPHAKGPPLSALIGPVPHEEFAGREEELEHLEHALLKSQRGELRIVLVEGESGVGKSELVAAFLRAASTRFPQLLALRGRCYENEQVSYKAFDGCIDELAKLMARMPPRESAALLPVRAHLLAQLFPVLRNIRAVEKAPREASSADLSARRLEAFSALAALFSKIGKAHPLVLVVEDLQWADAESFRLLSALVSDNTQPGLLLLATIRPRDELEPAVLEQVKTVRSWTQTEVVQLFGLPLVQARAVAARLLGADANEQWLHALAKESGGHPLFLRELVEYSRRHEPGSQPRLSLDAALRARIERLDSGPRQLLELAALAARPYGRHVFARALAVDEVDEPARTLLAEKLLRSRKSQELGCYHDRIRRVSAELIPAQRSVILHRRLAAALAADVDIDPVEQARHWDLAGDRERAIVGYERAVARAIETLAFTRAAQLCARAVELIGNADDPVAQRLAVQRAHALACIGHSAEAAALYERAAERAEGEARIRLRSRSAQQLMLSGNIGRGFAAARALLLELGVSVPLGAPRALLRFAWDQAMLALARMRRRSAGSLLPAESRRRITIDVIDELSHGVWLAHPMTMLTLSTQQMRLAAGLNSAERSALALTTRGWLLAVSGSYQKALPLFDQSRSLLKGSSDAPKLGMQAYTEGSARIAGFDWAGGSSCLLRAQQLAQEHCPDWPWLITNVRYHLGVAWYHLGEHRRLAREMVGWLAEARERNNALAAALLTGLGHGFVRHLLADDPEAALSEREQTLAAISPEPFSFAHFGHFMTKSMALSYQGGPSALHFVESFVAEHQKAPLLKSGMVREVLVSYEQSAHLHACLGATAAEQKQRIASARALAPVLARSSPLLRAYSSLALAQADALDGQRERALAQVRVARAQFDELGHVTRFAALSLEGLLEGGSSGREKQSSGTLAFEQRGWRAPLSAIAMSVPALPLLLASAGAQRSGRTALLLGRYEVVAKLGSAHGKSLLAARDVHTGRTLALSELGPGSDKRVRVLMRELRALSELSHENLERIAGLFADKERWYFATELVGGSDLLAYARRAGRCDDRRLCSALLGAARGLRALHDAGFVHRDIRPDNIRVVVDGRAVLLGSRSISRAGDDDDAEATGTPGFAAPEQLSGARPEPSADVYALGACIREARREREHAERVPAAPEDALSLCCARMLDEQPNARPGLQEVIDTLTAELARAADEGEQQANDEDAFEHASKFVGRAEELERLANAFERTCDDGFTLTLVEGESGVGKSTLAGEFARRLDESWPSLHVLYGRCYEHQQVAYKAFDGAVEKLARILRSYPNPQCEALLPRRAALLGQLFPALNSVPAIAGASRQGLPAEPSAQQLAARDSFVELLENLSDSHELLFVVDDLQWADAESFALLRLLIKKRERLPLLFVATLRTTRELSAATARQIEALRALPATEHFPIEGLQPEAARELAAQLALGELGDEQLSDAVRASAGNPLFLRELVGRKQRGARVEPGRELTFERALSEHLSALTREARWLLGLIALAGRPLGMHVYARAMAQRDLPRGALEVLLERGLVRLRRDDQLTCEHDRLRQVMLSLMNAAHRLKLARELASALDAEHNAEPAERARLWEEAGDRQAAVGAYEQAGDRALDNLAFAPAERHFQRAIELLTSSRSEPSSERPSATPVRLARLLAQRGHALACAGKSAEAARVFQNAADQAEGETRVRLRMRAAQQLIQSAQVDEGMRAAHALLDELGLALPVSDGAARARIAFERARIKLRGTGLEPHARGASAADRLLLDTLQGLSAPVRAVAYLPGSTLVMQYLRRALAAGDPLHAARALAFEALYRSVARPDDDQRALFDRSRELADLEREPALRAEIELLHGVSCLARGQFGLAPAFLTTAHELLATRCPGKPWLLTMARMYVGASFRLTGDFAALARHGEAWLEEARARDDRFALAALSGFGCASLRHLVEDAPERAQAELDGAMAAWPREPFSISHFGAFIASSVVVDYGERESLLAWADRDRTRRKGAHLMSTALGRFVDQQVTLLGILRALPDTRGDVRGALLRRGERGVRVLERHPSLAARGFAAMIGGVLDALRGELDPARRRLQHACELLRQAGCAYALGARYLHGLLEGGDGGREQCEPLLEAIQSEGWRDPERALALRAPGLRLLVR